jgi:hypothetical protein
MLLMLLNIQLDNFKFFMIMTFLGQVAYEKKIQEFQAWGLNFSYFQ